MNDHLVIIEMDTENMSNVIAYLAQISAQSFYRNIWVFVPVSADYSPDAFLDGLIENDIKLGLGAQLFFLSNGVSGNEIFQILGNAYNSPTIQVR